MLEKKYVNTSFYRFQILENFEQLKEPLLCFCKKLGMKGTILLAREGINSTISGTRDAMDKFYKYLTQDLGIKVDNFKESFSSDVPFLKMKVRLKKEIVAMGMPDIDVNNLSGKYVSPQDWPEFIARDDVVVIDTRNDYEIRLGSFSKSIDPKTRTFREFPRWVEDNKEIFENKKIAMFCTGGVRCEKSTALMTLFGYKDVYHLEGGVIKYFEETGNVSKSWHGDCFVFDDRVALSDNLEASKDLHCESCGNLLTTDDIRETSRIKKVLCINCNHFLDKPSIEEVTHNI